MTLALILTIVSFILTVLLCSYYAADKDKSFDFIATTLITVCICLFAFFTVMLKNKSYEQGIKDYIENKVEVSIKYDTDSTYIINRKDSSTYIIK